MQTGKQIFWLVALTACAGGLIAQTSLKSKRISGNSYVAVGDVAQFYGLGRDQARSADIAEYRVGGGTQLSVKVDRREATINGVQHWLCGPVTDSDRRLWISRVDVLKTLDPVLRSGGVGKRPVRTIVLDPGHGGSDRGTRGRKAIEKDLTLDLAKRTERLLEARGLQVYLTRTGDRTLSLDDRVEYANRRKADLFISIHFNSGGNADGIETYCVPPAGIGSTASPSLSLGDKAVPGNRNDELNVWLAHCVQDVLVRATRAEDRGVKRARFYVLRNATCPAILVEAGFLSNRSEELLALDPDYREKLARSIDEGVANYRKAVE